MNNNNGPEPAPFWSYRVQRVVAIFQNYANIQHPKFSLYQRLFKLSVDEKLAYRLYLDLVKNEKTQK
jgi:hypothetical protein